MKHSTLILALLATSSLVACKKPAEVSVPAAPVAVPGPAGPQGESGKSGDGGAAVVKPPASAPGY